MKYIKAAILISFFVLPVLAWGYWGLLVWLGIYFLTVLNKNRKISSSVAVFPMGLAGGIALHSVVISTFSVIGIWSWFVPGCYLLIAIILSIHTKASK